MSHYVFFYICLYPRETALEEALQSFRFFPPFPLIMNYQAVLRINTEIYWNQRKDKGIGKSIFRGASRYGDWRDFKTCIFSSSGVLFYKAWLREITVISGLLYKLMVTFFCLSHLWHFYSNTAEVPFLLQPLCGHRPGNLLYFPFLVSPSVWRTFPVHSNPPISLWPLQPLLPFQLRLKSFFLRKKSSTEMNVLIL